MGPISSLLAVLKLCQEDPGHCSPQVHVSRTPGRQSLCGEGPYDPCSHQSVRNTHLWWQRAALDSFSPLGTWGPSEQRQVYGSDGAGRAEMLQTPPMTHWPRAVAFLITQLQSQTGLHISWLQPVDTLGLLASTCFFL